MGKTIKELDLSTTLMNKAFIPETIAKAKQYSKIEAIL